MIPRHLDDALRRALADTPAVFLGGPRQVGKSTLARDLCSGTRDRRYVTLDDLTVLAAATRDPDGFLAGLAGDVVLDEAQRAPGLFLSLKAAIDRGRRPGRFLLTGSAAVLALHALAEALAGRVEILTLWPLSQGELRGVHETFVDALFAPAYDASGLQAVDRCQIIEEVALGGFPEVRTRRAPDRRDAWFRSYVSTLLQREVRDLAAIARLAELPHLLRLLAERTGGLVNVSDLARATALPQSTLSRYLALLEGLFLVRRLPPWSGNRTSRLVKASKLYPVDTGIAAHLLDLDAATLADAPDRLGPLLEAFVVGEIVKQLGWSRTAATPYFFRTHTGQEVDLVLEDRRGRCAAIEIKSAASVAASDLRGLDAFARQAGRKFLRGVVLYLGREAVPFSDRVEALPISALWGLVARGG
jgi:hypothetical protein